ncbi:type VI secretion system Vgr family protein [Aquimarina algicola]|uniref:Gp5/Type VI secretion system Vgr protein OB-fold domain-containing protein n=1 Tax=Aquimarina algicola TaxID=2589995 RepID=A0A504JH63_9FLAO|nr:phage baseplate assembly protein V [Aquimarina algicola]TPN88042.1 hypothetical protein FHK87_10755 [Aquimarina algicola]
MATDTQVQIYIGGEQITAFKKLTLHQEIDAHHTFELVCRKDVLESISPDVLGESLNFLGEIFLLKIRSENGFLDTEELKFKGLVTNINTVKGFYQSTGDWVYIKGKGCSIIADDGPHYASHKEISLSEILEETFMGYNRSALELQFNPQKTNVIQYSVQQHESAFEYASRLAAQYGEWFYYNGSQLVFGTPENKDSITLRYGYDLLELSVNVEAAPNSFNYFTNDYLNDTYHEVKTKEVSTNANGYIQFANKKSEEIFHKETQVFVSSHDSPSSRSGIDEKIALQKRATEINQVIVKGKSSQPAIQIGSVIKIEGESSSYGGFRIIKVDHSCNENGKYENTFEAVTTEIDAYPKTSIKAFPKSKSQTAVVVNNADPEGLGRVQVQYPWQKSVGETTPWVRLSSTAGGPGQGFYFVPEVGDEVIMGHEGDNAEIPIVMGSVYNSSSVPDSFKSSDNHLKAIRTRSGNQVTLNDTDGSVTIKDPSGNTITMAGNGEITINAPNKITFSSTDIAIEASNDVTVNAGNTISSTAATDINSSAGANVAINAANNMNAKAGSKASLKGSKSVSVFGKRVSITGTIMANIQSGAILTLVTAGVLNVTGAARNLLNGAKVKILGQKVEIN